MSWTLAPLELPCSSCRVRIARGTPVRWVTKARQPWCPGCALRNLQEPPPADLEPLSEPVRVPAPRLPFERVDRIAARVLPELPALERDGKRLATGDED